MTCYFAGATEEAIFTPVPPPRDGMKDATAKQCPLALPCVTKKKTSQVRGRLRRHAASLIDATLLRELGCHGKASGIDLGCGCVRVGGCTWGGDLLRGIRSLGPGSQDSFEITEPPDPFGINENHTYVLVYVAICRPAKTVPFGTGDMGLRVPLPTLERVDRGMLL